MYGAKDPEADPELSGMTILRSGQDTDTAWQNAQDWQVIERSGETLDPGQYSKVK